MSNILVCVPMNPTLPDSIKDQFLRSLSALLHCQKSDHYVRSFIDDRKVEPQDGDARPWSKVTRARNTMLEAIEQQAGFHAWDYLLWIDADVVQFPDTMAADLVASNPLGVTAPLVLVEGSNRLYDWAANIILGKDIVEPDNRWSVGGRNLQHEPPYWPSGYLNDAKDGLIPMACTGTITMVPTWIYTSGARYFDHPAFTDHYPICTRCWIGGQKVIVDTKIIAYHADLPKYGLGWH